MEAETRLYEISYLLRGNVSEDEALKTSEDLRKLIEDKHGLITQETKPQKQNLAYKIKRQETSHFGSFQFLFQPEKVLELEKSLEKFDLLRFSIARLESKQEKKAAKPILRRRLKSKELPLEEEVLFKEPLQVEEIDKKLEELLGQ